MSARLRDEKTGRPLDGPDHQAVLTLTDAELEEELTIAAAAPAKRHYARFDVLWREWLRRRDHAGLL
jgi:hypothetical protein